MDITPAAILHAPAQTTDDPPPSLERSIGELVAATAAALAAGLREKAQRDKLTAGTLARGGDLVMGLYTMRQLTVADWSFDSIAREHGRAVLLEASGADVEAATIDELICAVMSMLERVTRATAN